MTTKPLNLCRVCGHDFAGITYFDQHRGGRHAYTLTEGLRFDPPVEDGRRCLSESEMREMGLEIDGKGRWSDPRASERLATAYTRTHFSPTEAERGVSSPETGQNPAQGCEALKSLSPDSHDAKLTGAIH